MQLINNPPQKKKKITGNHCYEVTELFGSVRSRVDHSEDWTSTTLKSCRWPVLGNRCRMPSEVKEGAVKVKRNYPIFRFENPTLDFVKKAAPCEVILHPCNYTLPPAAIKADRAGKI